MVNGSGFVKAASFCIAVLVVFAPHAYALEETGLAVAFDTEGKSQNALCREARQDAARKVPKGATNVRYGDPAFKGRTISGKPGHNCVVYVYFDRGNQSDDEANPYKLDNQLTPQPKNTAAQRECEKYNGTWTNGRCKAFCEGKPMNTEIPNAGGASCAGE